MSRIAIRASHLAKHYKLGKKRGYRTLRDSISGLFTRSARHSSDSQASDQTGRFWALDDVSFEIPQGETVGIIGRNGAGKSTLLKVLARVTEPTSGHADIEGRVGSLLEVGAGFHPELTGRENVFLSGAILGMKRVEIQQKLEAIVAFAELDRFIDTPVKHYSSGMHLRLGFSVGVHLETDILMLDEVLAVGDVHFQRRCVEKIGDICRQGRTILFVSHNMGLIRKLCTTALMIRAGSVGLHGPCDEVVQAYIAQNSKSDLSDLSVVEDRKGAGAIRLRSVRFERADGRAADLVCGEPARIVLSVSSSRPHYRVQACVAFLNEMNERLMYLNSYFTGADIEVLDADGELVCDIPRVHLAPGQYGMEIWVKSSEIMQDRISDIGPVQVRSGDFFGTGARISGATEKVLMDFAWKTQVSRVF